jgi:hypothetical protein
MSGGKVRGEDPPDSDQGVWILIIKKTYIRKGFPGSAGFREVF